MVGQRKTPVDAGASFNPGQFPRGDQKAREKLSGSSTNVWHLRTHFAVGKPL